MSLNTFLRYTVLTSLFLVFLVPFIRIDDLFFPFITGKAFFFRFVIEIGFAAWVLLVLRDPAARPRKSWILWAFVAFMVVIGLADMFGENPWKSFWSNFERMEGYLALLHLGMYFLMAASVLSTEKLWKRFLETSVWTSLAVSLFAVFQLAGVFTINQGGVRVDATFGNATYLASYLLFNIFFTLVLLAKDDKLWKRISYGVIFVLHLIILYFTATRGSILGLIGGLSLAALLIALFDKTEKRKRIIAGSALGVLILIVGGFLAIKNTSFVQNSMVLSRFATISWNDTKTQARGFIWPMAVTGIKERPILGWGQDNFNYIFNENFDPRMHNQEQWFDHAHNVVLDWMVVGGILGFLAYFSMHVSAVYLLWKKTVDVSFTEKALLTGLGAGYFFHNLFVFDNLVSYILFFSVLAYIHFKSTRLSVPIAEKAGQIDESGTRVAGAFVLLALVFCLYFFNWRAYATSTNLIKGLQAVSVTPQRPEVALAAFEKALSYGTLGRAEVVERIVEAAPAINRSSVSLELRQKFYEMGQKAVDEQLLRYPGDARYEIFAGNFYGIFGNFAEAEKHLMKAVELSPRKQSHMYQLGTLYFRAKEFDKALPLFQKAYELEISNDNAKQAYGVALLYAGRELDARTLLGSIADDVFAGAYVELGEWDKAISILRKKVNADPRNLKLRMDLVSTYYQSGNKSAAIAELRQMIVIEPGFKTEGEGYIKQIEQGQAVR